MKRQPRPGLIIISVLLCLFFARTVLAHDGGPRILLNLYQIAPGQTLQVQGINLGTDLVVKVTLVGEETAVSLGEALCDGHGDFVQQYTLPADLPLGIYTVQAIDTSVVGRETVMAEAALGITNNPLPTSNQTTFSTEPAVAEAESWWSGRNLLTTAVTLLAVTMLLAAFVSRHKETQSPTRQRPGS